jgi:hypothetical protein
MKKYYLHNGTEQTGPFDIEELKANNIKKETPIWYEGLSEWTTAGKIEELEILFKVTTPPPFSPNPITPPLHKSQTNESFNTEKKGNKTGLILTLIGVVGAIVIAIFFILSYLNNKGSGSQNIDPQTYQEKVMTVEEIEKANPSQFLDASGNYRENLFGDAMKVNGTIKNNATVANYKDVVVEVIFYSETDTELDRKQYTIFDFVPAHSTVTFKLKIDRPQACKKLGWNAISATPY